MPPAVMPFSRSPPAMPETCSGKITPFWNPTPIQNDTPAIRPLR